jgi:5-methylcytosine-specific restriction endonuclease McrA
VLKVATCPECKVEFSFETIGGNSRRKYCADACMRVAYLRRYNEERRQARSKTKTRVCSGCGNHFQVHSARGSSGRRYCSAECYAAIARERRKAVIKPESVAKTCLNCGRSFVVRFTRGHGARKHCSIECRSQYSKAVKEEQLSTLPACSTLDCGKPAVRRAKGLCEMCYGRLRRTGTLRPGPRRASATSNGYVRLIDHSHPLANDGSVTEHRKVLYDAIGAAPHSCFWCAAPLLTWAKIVVDHLNEVKTDNRRDNLVPACNDCNRSRGAMLPFVRRLSDAKFDELVRVFKALRDSERPSLSLVKAL